MFGQEDYDENHIRIQQEIPEVQEQEEAVPAQSELFGDFIIKYSQNIFGTLDMVSDSTFQIINEIFGVLYVPLRFVGELEITGNSYNTIPNCYTYMDLDSLNASGITRLQIHPYLMLRGSGTAVAIIDSGIDYQNPLFRNENGSRIAYLWDQTLLGNAQEKVPYGRVFTKEEIDQALQTEQPLELVPSVDTNGHGTALAGVAAGNINPGEEFAGAAPEATLIVIKLKTAKTYLKEFYLYPSSVDVFQEDDIMTAIYYAVKWARDLQMPLSICLGIGSSQGAHMGDGPLSQYIDYVTGFSQISVSVAAGNEGSARHHFYGELTDERQKITTELKVGEKESGFAMEFWGSPPETYLLSVQSPTGEVLEISTTLGAVTQRLSFVFVETKILVNYITIERLTGYPLIYFRFLNPAPGIWRIVTQQKSRENAKFHMWLPVQGLISPETYFLESSPYTTVTAPGDSHGSITVTAYQHLDNSFYLQASRGFTPEDIVVPQLAAPGVGISVPLLNGNFGELSGTSLATAQVAGAAALLFEWAIVRQNDPYFTGNGVKNYFQRGARRDDNQQYPSKEWGYGRLDLYHTFELLT